MISLSAQTPKQTIIGVKKIMSTQNENGDPSTDRALLFSIDEASKILGNMPLSTIRKLVRRGTLKRCERLGNRPFYFTKKQLQDFIEWLEGDFK